MEANYLRGGGGGGGAGQLPGKQFFFLGGGAIILGANGLGGNYPVPHNQAPNVASNMQRIT